MLLIQTLAWIFAGAAVVAVIALVVRRAARRALLESLGTSLFLIKVPRDQGKEKDVFTEVGRFEQLLTNLHHLSINLRLLAEGAEQF